MHECAHLHMACCEYGTCPDTHTDCGQARMKRDISDFDKVRNWLHDSNPFMMNDECLTSLQSGLTANDSGNVTCDDA